MGEQLEPKRITAPLDQATIDGLHSGDHVLISGTLLTARDAAHKRLVEALERGEPLPVDLTGQVVYYVGPAPAKPGQPIGSAGPTTSGRLDPYTPALLEAGMRGMIGKGYRSPETREAIAGMARSISPRWAAPARCWPSASPQPMSSPTRTWGRKPSTGSPWSISLPSWSTTAMVATPIRTR